MLQKDFEKVLLVKMFNHNIITVAKINKSEQSVLDYAFKLEDFIKAMNITNIWDLVVDFDIESDREIIEYYINVDNNSYYGEKNEDDDDEIENKIIFITYQGLMRLYYDKKCKAIFPFIGWVEKTFPLDDW
jgi:hypothetical protein